jgi:DNA-directed RNA polymerase subunit M/transcription elongation factor TFIIS
VSPSVIMSEQQNLIHSEQQIVVPKQKMSCIVCGKLYSSKHFLQKHIMLHRLCPVQLPPATEKTVQSCGYCGSEFGNARIYIEHMTEVAKNLKRIKTSNIGEEPGAKILKEEDATKTDPKLEEENEMDFENDDIV